MRLKTITTIPTHYAGITFRSKNEARFAAWCDTWRVRWEYEPEGFQIGSVRYLPDFWLPEGKTLVEIKPPLFLHETWKLDALAKALNLPDGEYRPDSATLWCGTMTREGFELIRMWKDFGWETLGLQGVWCKQCGWPHFTGLGLFDCRRCHAYDGDHYLGVFEDLRLQTVIPPKQAMPL